MGQLLRDAWLVSRRDLRIEARSRVVLDQVLPFSVLVLVLFGFALDADHRTLRTFAPGLFWVAVLLSALLAVQRSAALDRADGTDTALRMSGLSPAALFLGRATAVYVQVVALQVVLVGGLLVFYGVDVEDPAVADPPPAGDHHRVDVVGAAEQHHLLGQVGLGDRGGEPAVDHL